MFAEVAMRGICQLRSHLNIRDTSDRITVWPPFVATLAPVGARFRAKQHETKDRIIDSLIVYLPATIFLDNVPPRARNKLVIILH